MKFSCEKAELTAAITIAARSAASKSPIPALEGLLIEAGSSVRVTGYDLKKGVYTSFAADVTEPGSIVLGARIFGDIIRSLPDGTVFVSSDRKNMTTITCGDSEFAIMGTASEDYPELPAIEGGRFMSLPQKLLGDMINQTIFAVSDNESRPVYTGSLFEIRDGELTLVSVDGYRLALRREKIDGAGGEDCSFIVPGGALRDLEKLCGESEDAVSICLGAKHISFSIGDTVMVSRRLEGEFLNYNKAVPSVFSINVYVTRTELSRVVGRVSLIIDEKTRNPLRLTFGDGEIKLSCLTGVGKAEDICPIEGDGTGMEIGFNNRYLLDALRAAPTDKLKVCLNSGSSPCVFAPSDGGDSFIYMILPVRLNAGV